MSRSKAIGLLQMAQPRLRHGPNVDKDKGDSVTIAVSGRATSTDAGKAAARSNGHNVKARAPAKYVARASVDQRTDAAAPAGRA